VLCYASASSTGHFINAKTQTINTLIIGTKNSNDHNFEYPAFFAMRPDINIGIIKNTSRKTIKRNDQRLIPPIPITIYFQ